jgi:predicted DNA-binding ArsR family transcriptional regulator
MTHNKAYSNSKACFIDNANIQLCAKIINALAQNGMTSTELVNFLGVGSNHAILIVKKLEIMCVIRRYPITVQGQTMNFYQLCAD